MYIRTRPALSIHRAFLGQRTEIITFSIILVVVLFGLAWLGSDCFMRLFPLYPLPVCKFEKLSSIHSSFLNAIKPDGLRSFVGKSQKRPFCGWINIGNLISIWVVVCHITSQHGTKEEYKLRPTVPPTVE